MKKLTLLLLLCVFGSFITAQNAFSLRTPASNLQFAEGNTQFLIGPGASFQHVFGDHHALGLNFDFLFGLDSLSANNINIEPSYQYYFKSAFDGFHLGSNIGYEMFFPKSETVGSQSSYSGFQLGAALGYTVPFATSWQFDFTLGGGYTVFLAEGTTGSWCMRPAISFGRRF